MNLRLKNIGILLAAHLAIGAFSASSAMADDFKLHRYVAGKWNTNSYFLESNSGVVLIDAQLFRSDAKLLATLIKSTGKPIVGALITHPHTDHFGGLNALAEELGPFPIYTTQKTADGFKSSHAVMLSWGLGDDFDATFLEADHIVPDGAVLELAGIKLVVDDIGAGESENSILIFQPDRNILFTGDATMHGAHFYVGEGYSNSAIAQHRYIQDKYGNVTMLYPGHGDPARPSAVLESEIEYITFFQALVKDVLKSGDNMKEDGSGLTDAAVAKITAAVLDRYPYLGDYGIGAADIVSWNIPGLVAEFSADNSL